MSDITIAVINIYPLKSGRGISLPVAKFDRRGLENDRRWALADSKTMEVLTQREISQLATLIPKIEDSELVLIDSKTSETIHVPIVADLSKKVGLKWKYWNKDKPVIDQGDAAAIKLSELLNRDVRLVYQPIELANSDYNVALVDDSSVLIISDKSLEDANMAFEEHGIPRFSMNKFRPTIEVQTTGPYEEDSWRIAKVSNQIELASTEQCVRCSLPNTDQETGIVTSTSYLKVLKQHRGTPKPILGMYFNNINEGNISVGDKVKVLRA